MTTWPPVEAEHRSNVGFRTTGDRNPWTQELGIGNTAYCIAAATVVAHHHGVQWWPDAQFGAKGYAYCPYGRAGAARHGVWEDDHASQGRPARLQPGDIVLYDWGGDGVADHAETVKAIYADGTFDTYGYNTGNPNGCWIVRRDRRYLMGRIRMTDAFYGAAEPAAPAATEEDDMTPEQTKQLADTAAMLPVVFVDTIYRTYGHRDPDPGGLEYWSSQIPATNPLSVLMRLKAQLAGETKKTAAAKKS
ncbi:MAG TPA: hypothetical protein VFJ14_17900 [Nocardioidaceae bacterium]|nr:hypothetical protein [Nocardioidaceae bacterium]